MLAAEGAVDRGTARMDALRALDHPNVATEALAPAPPAGPVGPERAVALITQVASGLAHAHRRGVVHGSIGVDRLHVRALEDGTDQVKVIFLPDGSGGIAPEQLAGRPVDHRADVWATGALLFRLLTGREPGVVPTDRAVPPALVSVIARCLADRPEDRYPDVGAFVDAVHAAVRPAPEPLPSPPAAQPRPGWVLGAGLVVVAILVGLAAAYAALELRGPPPVAAPEPAPPPPDEG